MQGPNADFMKIAVEEAIKGVNEGDGGPFGAVVVKDGNIIAKGHNMVIGNHDATAHAEITAIRNACEALGTHDLTGCQLYTSCYPCPMCMGACLWARLNAVYFAATSTDAANADFDDSHFHEFVKNPITNEGRVWEQLKIDEYLSPFNEWKRKADRVPY
jgi:guanine deaminase